MPELEHPCSNLVVAALMEIRRELDRVMGNINHQSYHSPFDNTANSFQCPTFQVQAYAWGDPDQPFNFKWKDVEIGWYKYAGRGMTSSVEIKPDLASQMLDDCLAALRQLETQADQKRRPAPVNKLRGMSGEETLNAVRSVVARSLGVNEFEVQADSSLQMLVDADPNRLDNLALNLDVALGCDIDLEAASKAVSVGDLAQLARSS